MKKPTKFKQWLRRLAVKTLFPVDQSRGWIPIVQESFLGAFQTDTTVTLDTALTHPTVYACISQIAYDIGKLGLRLTKLDAHGISVPTKNERISKVLKRPNKFQTRQKFIESWLISLLTYGNTYVLKARDAKSKVIGLYILAPNKVEPLIADNGDVFYRLRKDRISRVNIDIDAVPAYEIIHDTMVTLFHPLVGIPPLYAGTLAVAQGLAIQNYSANFFENNAKPSGILTAPGHIKKETAEAIQTAWQTGYAGENAGKIAVLGDGLKYEAMTQTAEESELSSQLAYSDEKICSIFKVPPYKVHVGKAPTYEQYETLDRKYYSDCLQSRIEAIETLLDEGLFIPADHGTKFNLDDLLKMDFKLQMETQAVGVKGGFLAPDEARKKINYAPVEGGDTPYMQQQNYSLAALNKRDKTNPLAVQPNAPTKETEQEEEEAQKFLIALRTKSSLIGVDE